MPGLLKAQLRQRQHGGQRHADRVLHQHVDEEEDEVVLQRVPERRRPCRVEQQGVEIAEAIPEPQDGGKYAEMQFTLQVQNRLHLARIMRELRRIPAGETRSYADIAAAVGKPKAVRAAGSANGANNVAVLIPCHRVVRSDGTLGGYAYGLPIKEELLKRESF